MSDQRGPEAPWPPDDAPPPRVGGPPPLWYTPPGSPPAPAPPPSPPPPVPTSVQPRSDRGVVASFVALMVFAVVAVGAVVATAVDGGSDDAGPTESTTPSAAAWPSPRGGTNCGAAEIVAPFERLPSDISSVPASAANRVRANDRFAGASGAVELRDVRYGDQLMIAGVAAGVNDPQKFIDDFINRNASYSGAPPRTISVDGRQAALVTVDLAPTYGTALVTFMECRVVIVLGRDENSLMTVAGALASGG